MDLESNQPPPRVPILRISTQPNSLIDQDETQVESLPSENTSDRLTRRTTDLPNVNLAKSHCVELPASPMTPFGPKTRAFIVPSKSFDIATVELDLLENYNLWSDIGRGTYAVVKFATNKADGRKFAIKVYEKSKIQEPMRQKSIKREIKILKMLKHPNIVGLHEEISGEKNLYLVMEYVKGFSLQAHIGKFPWKRLDEPEAAEIFNQLMEALAYCHAANVSHRDIKLENVLLDERNQVKLIDFGFATISKVKNKKEIIYCGTPNYMAPEIIKKVNYEGPPVDVWACGVLLYIMVTGGFPYNSNKEAKVFKKVMKNDVIMPNYISFNCQCLIKDMLTTDPERRITAEQILRHPWVVNKGKSIGKNLPHKGDSIEVCIDDE